MRTVRDDVAVPDPLGELCKQADQEGQQSLGNGSRREELMLQAPGLSTAGPRQLERQKRAKSFGRSGPAGT